MAGHLYLTVSHVPYISVHLQGIPGCGKSVVLDHLSYKPNVQCFPEPVNKWTNVPTRAPNGQLNFVNLLEDYYTTGKNAFELQMYVRNTFFETCYQPCYRSVRVIERSVHAARAFYNPAQMTPLQTTIEEAWQHTLEFDPRFREDLVLYLRCDPEVALLRVHSRGRVGEAANLTLAAMKSMEQRHDSWLSNLAHVTVIDTSGSRETVIRDVTAAFDRATHDLGNLPPPVYNNPTAGATLHELERRAAMVRPASYQVEFENKLKIGMPRKPDPISPHVPMRLRKDEGPRQLVQQRAGLGQARRSSLSEPPQSLKRMSAPIPDSSADPAKDPPLDPLLDPWSEQGVLTLAQQQQISDELMVRQDEPSWDRLVTMKNCGTQVSEYPIGSPKFEGSETYLIPQFTSALTMSRFTQFPNARTEFDLNFIRQTILENLSTGLYIGTNVPPAELFDLTVPQSVRILVPVAQE